MGEKHCKNRRFCQDQRFSSLFCFSSILCAVNGPEWCIKCREPLIRNSGGSHHFEVKIKKKWQKRVKNTVKTAVFCQDQRFSLLFCFSSIWCAVNGQEWCKKCRKSLIRNSGRSFHHFEVKNQEKVAKTDEKHCKNSRFLSKSAFFFIILLLKHLVCCKWSRMVHKV